MASRGLSVPKHGALEKALSRETVSVDLADEIAVRYGTTAQAIWGDEFYGPIDPVRRSLAEEIAQGNVIRHWDESMEAAMKKKAAGKRLVPKDEVLLRAAELKASADSLDVQQSTRLFYGMFGPDRRNMAVDVPVDSRKARLWMANLRDQVNGFLPPGARPLSTTEVQARLRLYMQDFLNAERARWGKRLARAVTGRMSNASQAKATAFLDDLDKALHPLATEAELQRAWDRLAQTEAGKHFIENARRSFNPSPRRLAQKLAAEVKGETLFGPDFRATVRLFQTGDFTTLVHENAHLLRRLLPEDQVEVLWDVYRNRVHGPAPEGALFEAGTEGVKRLLQTVRSRKPHGAYAAVDTPNGELHEGQFVTYKGRTVRAVRFYEKDGKPLAEIQDHLLGTVKRNVPAGDLEIIPEHDPYALGLLDPEGIEGPGSMGDLRLVKTEQTSTVTGSTLGYGDRKFAVGNLPADLEEVFERSTAMVDPKTGEVEVRPQGSVSRPESIPVPPRAKALGQVTRISYGTGEGAKYRRYVGTEGTLTAGEEPTFSFGPEGNAMRKAWRKRHENDPVEIRAVVTVDTTGGKQKITVTPMAKMRTGEWVSAEELVGPPVPQPRPEPGVFEAYPDFAPPARTTVEWKKIPGSEWNSEYEEGGYRAQVVKGSEGWDWTVYFNGKKIDGYEAFSNREFAKDAAIEAIKKHREQAAQPAPESRGGGAEALMRDIATPEPEPVFRAEVSEGTMKALDDLWEAHFAGGQAERIGPRHPLGRWAQETEGVILTEGGLHEWGSVRNLDVPADTPEGTIVVFSGDKADIATYGIVREIDPNDERLLYGNVSRAESLERTGGANPRILPVVIKNGDNLIIFEGNHTRYWATRADAGSMKYLEVDPNARLESLREVWDEPEMKKDRASRDVQAEQAARGGLDEAAEAAAQDDFAARLNAAADQREWPTPEKIRERGTFVTDAEMTQARMRNLKPKKKDVAPGKVYEAKVGQNIVQVRITGENPHGGWDAVNLQTKRNIRIRSVQRLRREIVGPSQNVPDVNVERTFDTAAARAEAAEKAAILRDAGLPVDEEQLLRDIEAREGPPPGATQAAESIAPESLGEGVPGGGPPPTGPPPSGPLTPAPPGTPILPPGRGIPLPGRRPWSRGMEEAFAEDAEKWFYNNILPDDEKMHPAFRTLRSSLRELWQRVRGFGVEQQLIPDQAAATFDRYFGQSMVSPPLPNPRMSVGLRRRSRNLAIAPIAPTPVSGQVVQMAGDSASLHAAANAAQLSLRRKLSGLFNGPKNFRTQAKDIARLERKLSLGVVANDALQARVVVDNWVKAEEAVARLAEAGLEIVGIEDTRGAPGMFGSRGLKVWVRDPDAPEGFISEIEFGTPMYERMRNLTAKHEAAARDLVVQKQQLEEELLRPDLNEKQADEIGEALAEVTAQIEAARRYMEGMYEPIVDEMDAHLTGGVAPGGAERSVLNELRWWVAGNIEADMFDTGYADFRFLFERLYYPIRKQNGGEFNFEEGDWVGGGDAYVLDEERALMGLPQPIYFHHMKPPPKLSDFILQRGKTMLGARKLAENKALKRTTGALMEEDAFGNPAYLTDLELVYSIRASKAIKARDTYEMVSWVTNHFARPITDPSALAPGEVLFAPDFTKTLFKAVITLEDRLGSLVKQMPNEAVIGLEGMRKSDVMDQAAAIIAKGLRGQLNVQEIEAGALLQAIDETLPLVKKELIALTGKGVDLYAIPATVAKRLEASVSGPLGMKGSNEVRLFWDAPTNLWRAITLYGRPAWLVNNFFGNLAFLKIGSGRFTDVVRQLFDPEYRDLVEQLSKQIPGVDVGYTTSVVEQYAPQLGTAGGEAAGEVMAAMQNAARGSKALRPFYKWGDALKFLNQLNENYFRRAGMIRGIEVTGDPVAVQHWARRFWTSKKDLERYAIDGLSPTQADRTLAYVDELFGDFSRMSPTERHVIRRFLLPFWGFYRHVLKLVMRLPTEYPGRFAVIRGIAEATEEMQQEFGPMPDWMDGFMPFGPVNLNGETRFVSGAGASPFNVVTDSALSMLHPAWKVVLERATGRDTFTGRPFTSPDVVVPYGSEQGFQVIRDETGKPIGVEPVEQVVPPLLTHVLSQIPQYDLLRNMAAGGRAYDTEGILGSIGQPVLNSRGEVVRPVGPLESFGKFAGISTFPFDVGSYQERLSDEQKAALAYALKQWEAQG
jgi:hypothetical protein